MMTDQQLQEDLLHAWMEMSVFIRETASSRTSLLMR